MISDLQVTLAVTVATALIALLAGFSDIDAGLGFAAVALGMVLHAFAQDYRRKHL